MFEAAEICHSIRVRVYDLDRNESKCQYLIGVLYLFRQSLPLLSIFNSFGYIAFTGRKSISPDNLDAITLAGYLE